MKLIGVRIGTNKKSVSSQNAALVEFTAARQLKGLQEKSVEEAGLPSRIGTQSLYVQR